MAHEAALETCKNLAVSVGLTFVHQAATLHSGELFFIYYGRTPLLSCEDIGKVEFYLYGYRDRGANPIEGAYDSVLALVVASEQLTKANESILVAKARLNDTRSFLQPLARER